MKITVVGALAIAAIVVLLIVIARFLRGQPPEDGKNTQK